MITVVAGLLLPVTIPVTIPVDPTVATEVTLLLHVPPDVASVRLVVDPWHTLGVPRITAGSGFTVTVLDVVQPLVAVYVISAVAGVLLPVTTPPTVPVIRFTVAIPVAPLTQVPTGPAGSLKLVVEPWQTVSVPVMPGGEAVTFTVVVAIPAHPAL